MNIFNRIIIIILLLCLFVSSVVIAVNIFADLFTWEDVFDRILLSIESTNPYITLAVFIAIAILSVVMLFFEFRRRRLKVANVASDQSGRTMVTLKTVAGQIREKLLELDNVTDPRVNIIPRKEGIIINASSKLTKGIGVADKTKAIREEISDFASKTLGFKVIKSNYTATGFVPPKIKKVKEDFITKKPEVSVKDKEPDIAIEPTDTPTAEDNND